MSALHDNFDSFANFESYATAYPYVGPAGFAAAAIGSVTELDEQEFAAQAQEQFEIMASQIREAIKHRVRTWLANGESPRSARQNMEDGIHEAEKVTGGTEAGSASANGLDPRTVALIREATEEAIAESEGLRIAADSRTTKRFQLRKLIDYFRRP